MNNLSIQLVCSGGRKVSIIRKVAKTNSPRFAGLIAQDPKRTNIDITEFGYETVCLATQLITRQSPSIPSHQFAPLLRLSEEWEIEAIRGDYLQEVIFACRDRSMSLYKKLVLAKKHRLLTLKAKIQLGLASCLNCCMEVKAHPRFHHEEEDRGREQELTWTTRKNVIDLHHAKMAIYRREGQLVEFEEDTCQCCGKHKTVRRERYALAVEEFSLAD